MAIHAKDTLRGASIAEVLDLAFAVSTAEAAGAKSLVSGEDSEILNLVAARRAAVGTVITYKRTVAEQEEVGV